MYCGQPHGCSRLANSLDRTAQKLIPEKLKIIVLAACVLCYPTRVDHLRPCFVLSKPAMAPDISSPPRAARNKRPAISSPPNPARYNRDQLEIACSWWAKKKDKVIALKRRVSQLQERIRILEEEA